MTIIPNLKSPTFCISPWIERLFNTSGYIFPCSRSRGFPYDFESPLDKQPSIEKLKKDLNEGIKHENCNKCWNAEKNGGISRRMLVNKSFMKYIEKKDDIENIKILEYPVDTKCTEICVMCSQEYSSVWQKYHRFFNRNMTRKIINYDDYGLLDQIVSLKSLKRINLVGGEPLIWKKMNHFLSKLDDKQVKIRIVTNLFLTSQSKYNLDLLKEYKNYELQISIHGIKNSFESISVPQKWNVFLNNIDYIIKKDIIWGTTTAIQALNLFDLYDLFVFIKKLSPIKMVSCNYVTNPSFLSLNILNKEKRRKYLDKIKIFENYVQGLNEVINVYYNSDQNIEDLEKFVIFIKKWKTKWKINLPNEIERIL